MVDAGSKHYIPKGELVGLWGKPANEPLTVFSGAFISLNVKLFNIDECWPQHHERRILVYRFTKVLAYQAEPFLGH